MQQALKNAREERDKATAKAKEAEDLLEQKKMELKQL
jgi:hypothetical protein